MKADELMAELRFGPQYPTFADAVEEVFYYLRGTVPNPRPFGGSWIIVPAPRGGWRNAPQLGTASLPPEKQVWVQWWLVINDAQTDADRAREFWRGLGELVRAGNSTAIEAKRQLDTHERHRSEKTIGFDKGESFFVWASASRPFYRG